MFRAAAQQVATSLNEAYIHIHLPSSSTVEFLLETAAILLSQAASMRAESGFDRTSQVDSSRDTGWLALQQA